MKFFYQRETRVKHKLWASQLHSSCNGIVEEAWLGIPCSKDAKPQFFGIPAKKKNTIFCWGGHLDPMCSGYFGVASHSIILHFPKNRKPRTAFVCWIHLLLGYQKEMSEKGRNRFLTEDWTHVRIGRKWWVPRIKPMQLILWIFYNWPCIKTLP